MSLTRRVVSGVKWSATGRYSEQLLVLLTTAVLARLLAPEDFGVFGMAVLTTSALTVVADLGTSTALVQRPKISRRLVSSVFWLNVGLGILYFAVAAAGASLVAGFFQEPVVAPILTVLSVSLVFGGAAAVPQALLTRRLAFDRLAGAQLTAVAVGAAVGIGMAFSGMGAWSLVGQHVGRTAAEAVLLIALAGLRPAPVFDVAQLRSVQQFSLALAGSQVGSYLIRNLDNVLVGRVLGAAPLGYYDIAWRLIQYPLVAITSVVGRVLLPALSRLQGQAERFARAYLRSAAAIAFFAVPALIALFFLAEPAVRLILGDAWLPAVPLVMILAPVGLFQSIGSTTGNLYVARGATGRLLLWTWFAAPVTAAFFLVGVQFGVVGMAVSRLIANTLLSPLNFLMAARGTAVRLRDLGRALQPVAIAALISGFAILGVRLVLEELGVRAAAPLVLLAGAAGGLVYLTVLMMARSPVLRDVLETLGLAGLASRRRFGRWLAADSGSGADGAP